MLISAFVNSLVEKLNGLTNKDFWKSLLSVFLFVLLINGISSVPSQPYLRLSENPFVPGTGFFAEAGALRESLLLPVLAFVAGWNSVWPFHILCLAIIIGGFTLFAGLLFARQGAAPAFLFTTVLLTSPLTTILLARLGTPDGLTFVFTIPVFFTASAPLVAFLAALGSINHIAAPVAVVEILLLRWCARDGIKLRHILAAAVGGAAGYALLRAALAVLQISTPTRFEVFLSGVPAPWPEEAVRNLPMTVFSMFNIHWLLLIAVSAMGFKTDKFFYRILWGIVLLNGLAALFCGETTRIFSLTSWGVLMEGLVHSRRLTSDPGQRDREGFLQTVAGVGLASFVTPRYFSVSGEVISAPLYEFCLRIGNQIRSLF
jgi:hypothetical protein